jgi:DNA repair protein RadC
MSDTYLRGILLRSEDRRARKNAADLSRDLLNKFGILKDVYQASITEICQNQGIVVAKAAQIKSALEVGKRMAAKISEKK